MSVTAFGAAGDGAVHVPPGTYLLTGVVWVHRSGGMVWFMPREPRARLKADNVTGISGAATYGRETAARRLRPGWSPRFATLGPVVSESGIEDLTIEMKLTPQTAHHQDLGFNGPRFAELAERTSDTVQAAVNCWARDVDLWHSDNGSGSTTTKNLTLTGVRVGGRARHHTFICRVQTNDMLVDHFEIPAATTPVAQGAIHHGLNTEGLSGGNVWCDGVMEGTFDSHRALPFESVRTAITVTNNGFTGDASDAGPRWGARFCHWNVDVSSVADALDAAVYPTNLYEAQLRHRLRGTR